MRSQTSQPQESGEQKKSVFDRLGRQLDARSVNRGSPVNYGEHPMHHMMHDPDYGRFGRGDQHPDMNWRYESDRRHMTLSRSRHPPTPGQYHPQFDINLSPSRQPPQYFPPPSHHHPQYHTNPGAPPPALLMAPDVLAMEMHQRRPSPKYDRHGNPIRGSMRMDHLSGVSQAEDFMGPPLSQMLPPPGYDVAQMAPGMYSQNRWVESVHMDHAMHPRIPQDERFIDPHRIPQQPKIPIMIDAGIPCDRLNFDAPRYSKWRERRDAITNLDRQTAQSSSKTDSLKSSLQQTETKNHSKRGNKDSRTTKNDQGLAKQAVPSKESSNSTSLASKTKQDSTSKDEPTDISDGEIIDDEDSSDESDSQKVSQDRDRSDRMTDASNTIRKTTYGRTVTHEQEYYDRKKRRRLLDREDYPMDYETISDEELDEFITDQKLVEEAKLEGSATDKNSSEIELLNALGLDWANLIELSKQSKKEAPTSGSALRRFSLSNYLPTLGITRELAGPEIHDFILEVCQ